VPGHSCGDESALIGSERRFEEGDEIILLASEERFEELQQRFAP